MFKITVVCFIISNNPRLGCNKKQRTLRLCHFGFEMFLVMDFLYMNFKQLGKTYLKGLFLISSHNKIIEKDLQKFRIHFRDVHPKNVTKISNFAETFLAAYTFLTKKNIVTIALTGQVKQ